VKKSITVLGVEADGIRGVRLEESGTDWNCIDSGFWPIGGESQSVEDDASLPKPQSGAFGERALPDGESAGMVEELSADDRYAATVEALKNASKQFGANEIVLSMPLSSLLVKVSSMPVDERDRIADAAESEIGKVSPFPDETPITGIETVAETDRDLVTMFAALPESGAADIGDALDEAKVRVLRTDITALGWLRSLWPRIASQSSDSARRVVLMNLGDGWNVVVLDENSPSLLRGLGTVSEPVELGREITLSLLQAGLGAETGEIVVFSKREVPEELVERLKAFAPVRVERVEEIDANWGVDGVARRTLEGATLDVTPADWSELREESRFKKKLTMFLSVAAAGWVLVMGALFGGPIVYDQLTEHQKTICKRHSKAYKEVKEMRDKVKLVQQYSDHARGTLEMLKAVSDRMPEGVTLTSFNYRRGEKLSISGEADQPTVVYDFKNALTEAEIVLSEAEEGSEKEAETEKLFAEVTLTGPSKSRNTHKFSIECLFESAEEEGK
jgi:Tfp pilus assembly protein PilN